MDLEIKFQLVAKQSDEGILTSQWLTLPTTLCPGCTQAHGETTGCDDMVGEFCDYGFCELNGETIICDENGCPGESPGCTTYTYELEGQTPDVQGCVVAQMQGITQRCRDVFACEAN